MTIAIILKRKIEYRNAYLFGIVQPNKVMLSLNDLCNTTLYINEKIVINNEWKNNFEQCRQNLDSSVAKIEKQDSTILMMTSSQNQKHLYMAIKRPN